MRKAKRFSTVIVLSGTLSGFGFISAVEAQNAVYNTGPIYNNGPVYGTASAPVYADQAPYSSAAYAAAPPPVTPAVPAFRDTAQADAEQRRTAQMLAAQQREGSMQAAGSLNPVQYSAPPPAPRYATAPSAAPPPAAAYTPGQLVTETGAYSPDHYGAAIPPMPSARPGECFALVRRPEQYRVMEKQYVAKAGYERFEVMPARFQPDYQEIVVQEASERLEVVPATYRNVTEQMEIRPASTRYTVTEPEYETVTEQVMERAGRQVWKRGRGPIERLDNATGEIMCLVEEPPVFKTITRRVLRTPSQAREVQIPGEYRTVTRRVVDQPAQVRRVAIPEQRARVPVQRLAEPARVGQINVPDEIASTTIRELASPATLEWRPVLCQTNMTPDVVRRVQDALVRSGFNPGQQDGRLGASTIAALNAFQRSRNLPVDSYLNIETLRALGLQY